MGVQHGPEYAHGRVGHVFQGRFKGILVEKDAYLLELCRYVVLNPVRAQMVRSAKDWPWSSYRATAGITEPVNGLATDWILQAFGADKRQATEGFRRFVAQGRNQPSPWQKLKNQVYLGSDTFVEETQSKIRDDQPLTGVPKPQTLPPLKPLSYFVAHYPRNEGMARAYLSGHYSLATVGDAFGVSYATVGRAVKAWEEGGNAH